MLFERSHNEYFNKLLNVYTDNNFIINFIHCVNELTPVKNKSDSHNCKYSTGFDRFLWNQSKSILRAKPKNTYYA